MEEGRGVRSQDNEQGSAPDQDAGAGPNNRHAENGSVGEDPESDGMEDVYAIGFQELVDLNAVNVAIDIRSQARKRCAKLTLFRSRARMPARGVVVLYEPRSQPNRQRKGT